MKHAPIWIVLRSKSDTDSAKRALQEDFPFLGYYSDVLNLLAQYQEFCVGIPEDDSVDPETYDCFSLFPLEELSWRTDWKRRGYFAVASFGIQGEDTEIGISALEPDDKLYLWRPDEPDFCPSVCTRSLVDILDGVQENASRLADYVNELKNA